MRSPDTENTMKRFAICIVAIIVWALGVASCSSKADSKASTSTAMPNGDASPDSDATPSSDAATPTDATLSALVPSVGAFVPIFTASEMTYTLRVPNGTTNVALTPTSSNAGATIQVNGAAVVRGQSSPALAL